MAHLKNVLNVEWALVAQEEHKDGNLHLHAVVKLSKRLSTRDPRLLDIDGYHPSMERCKSIHASVKYVCKSDPDPLPFNVDPKNLLQCVS